MGVNVTLPAAVKETDPFIAPVTLVKVSGNAPGSVSFANTLVVTGVPVPQVTLIDTASGFATGGCGPESITTG